MGNDITLVVSKYTENIDWTNQIIHPVVIYDKSDNPVPGSIKRPNIGREAETLLFYIIENYFSLPSILIFTQGDPRGNPIEYTYEEVINVINNPPLEYKSLMNFDGNTNLKTYWIDQSQYVYTTYFGNFSELTWYSMGCEYILPKENILNRSLSFYKHLYYRLIDEQDSLINAYSLEPIFGTIFNTKINLRYDL